MSLDSLIRFLIQNSDSLTTAPINGCVLTIHQLFKSKHHKYQISLEKFTKQLDRITIIDPFSIIYKRVIYEGQNNNKVIEFINPVNLKIMLEVNNPSNSKTSLVEKINPKHENQGNNLSLEHLNDILSSCSTTKSKNNNSLDHIKLQQLLQYESAAHKLTCFYISKTAPKIPFLETCNDQSHSDILSEQSKSTSNTNMKISKDLSNCLQLKIHYIPLIKPHTDITLGDCSYLDTCHKLDSCRYTHYVKHIPQNEHSRQVQESIKYNSQISYFEKINPFSWTSSVSNLTREIQEPQWINCDVKKFNFQTLGKFAVIIADPPWNIHMNAPSNNDTGSSKSNDNDLLNIPFHEIQDEGIIFLWVTGRAIEIGKDILIKAGYKVSNELIWIKSNQLSRTICTGRTGHWLNHSKEHIIVGIKGNPVWLNKRVDVDYIVSQTRETSRKPDELYGIAERLVGVHSRKLEIFGKNHNLRPGWLSEYCSFLLMFFI